LASTPQNGQWPGRHWPYFFKDSTFKHAWAFSAIFKEPGLSLAAINLPQFRQYDSTLCGIPRTGCCLKRGLGVLEAI